MIKDPDTLSKIRTSWNGVEIVRGKIQRSLFASLGVVGGTYPFEAADAAHNLPFLQALSVLNNVLLALENEGRFRCKSIFLGALLNEAESELKWVDYDAIFEAKERRNELAHKGKLLPRGECWKHIDAVKAELVAWGIIDAELTESD